MALNDTFTASDGTLVTARASDSGHTWAAPSVDAGAHTINANRAYCTTTGTIYADWTPASADYDVTATWYQHTNQYTTGIVVRFDPATGNGYYIFLQHAASTVEIRRLDAGSLVNIGSGGSISLANGGSLTLRVELRGNDISIYNDATDAHILTITDGTHTAAGRVGLRTNSTVTTGAGRHIDSITADDVAAPNTAPTVDAGVDATITAGDTLTRTVSFTDPDADTWTATVDYGEGAGAVAATVDQGAKTVALSNLYETAGNYTVTVVVNDGTTTGQDSFTLTVNNAPTSGYYTVIDVAGTDAGAPIITLD